jgi:hypothetical protein
MDFNDWAGAQPLVGLGEHRPTHWGARLSQSELVPKKGFTTDINTPQDFKIQFMKHWTNTLHVVSVILFLL